MAKSSKSEAVAVASINPADFLQGGLKSDFRGRITEAVYCPWDYKGAIAEPVLGVRLTIAIEDEDQPYVDYWPAGSLESFVPSEDGRTPAEGEDGGPGEGPYAVKVGKRSGLNNNTNFAHLMQTIVDCGEASKHFRVSDLTSSLECLVGLDAHWDRVPQKKRSGMVDNDAETAGGEKKRRNNDVLVVTSVYGYGDAPAAKKGKPAPAAKGKPAPAEDEDEGGDENPLDAKLAEMVEAAIADAGGTIKRSKLAVAILKAAAKDKDKAKLVKRVSEEDFLSAGEWAYDEDEGTLTIE
jgi:hypothetical protein